VSDANRKGDVRELERQLARGSEVEAFVYGLADALLGKELVTTEELAGAVATVRRELDEAAEVPEAGVARASMSRTLQASRRSRSIARHACSSAMPSAASSTSRSARTKSSRE
jgi:hypothetical protein